MSVIVNLRHAAEAQVMRKKMTDHMAEAVSGFETIKLYGLKQWWMAKMSGLQREYLHVGNRAEAVAATQRR